MLVLPIKKKWFDMILSGEKKEEYREIKPYYDSRLNKKVNFCESTGYGYYILLRNGYSKNSPTLKVGCVIKKDYGNPAGKLHHLQLILIKNNGDKTSELLLEVNYSGTVQL